MHPSAQSADIPWSGQRVIDSELVRSTANEPMLEHLTDQVDASLNAHSLWQLVLARPELMEYDRESRQQGCRQHRRVQQSEVRRAVGKPMIETE
jgi:hypothetical protein